MMCGEVMTFPDTVEEYMETYKVTDTEGIYMSKGAELVPIFRMEQWFEHVPSAQPEIIHCKDCIYKKPSKFLKTVRCTFHGLTHPYAMPEDGFCSWAERRDE